MLYNLAILGPVGWPELIILSILGVLIFGKRLPEVGRGMGKAIVEFKKGLAGMEDEINHASNTPQQPKQISTGESASVEQPKSTTHSH